MADLSSTGPIVDDEGLYDLVVTAGVQIRHHSSSAGGVGVGENVSSGRRKGKSRSQRRAELMSKYGSLIAKSEQHLRTEDDRASLKKPRRAAAVAADVESASASLSAAAVDMQRDEARREIAAIEKTVDISDGSCVVVAAFGEMAALRLGSFSRKRFECMTNFKLIDEEVEYHG